MEIEKVRFTIIVNKLIIYCIHILSFVFYTFYIFLTHLYIIIGLSKPKHRKKCNVLRITKLMYNLYKHTKEQTNKIR